MLVLTVTPSCVLVGVLELRVFGGGVVSRWRLELWLGSWGWVKGRAVGVKLVGGLAREGSSSGGFGASE
jgi:hypothetical protein